MIITRDQLCTLAGIPGHDRDSIRQALFTIMSSLANKYGVTVFKMDSLSKQRGAKNHAYDVQEVISALKIYNADHEVNKRYRSSLQKKIYKKVIRELKLYKMNSKQAKLRRYENKDNLISLGKILSKATSLSEYDTTSDYCFVRSTKSQPVSHLIKLNDNKLRWESSTGKEGAYDFKSNNEAYQWVKENILDKIND